MRKRTPIPPLEEQAAFIDALGGPTDVAAMLVRRTGERVIQQTVSHWKKRGIPFFWRAHMALEAGERNIDAPPNFLNAQTPEPAGLAEAPFQ